MTPHVSGLQRGSSLVELMVGLSIGLVISAGALTLAMNQLQSLRRAALQSQLQQDMTAVVDLMRRELRRAGTWETPERALPASSGLAGLPNPYSTFMVSADGQSVSYSYARHDDRSSASPTEPEDQTVSDRERFAFRLQSARIDFKMGSTFQPLTDPGVIRVTQLRFEPVVVVRQLSNLCEGDCSLTPCLPQWQERAIRVTLRAQSVQDPRAAVDWRFQIALRNDHLPGACT